MSKDTVPEFLNKLDLNRIYTQEELELINDRLKVRTNFENGRLIPIPQNPIAHEAIVHEISRQLGNWNIINRQNGIVTTSQGGFNFSVTGRRKIRAPHIAFTPEDTYDSLNEKQLWTLEGRPFTPIFVAEVNVINHAIFNEIDNRFKNDYFADGTSVRLGWLLDPRNKMIWTYEKVDENVPEAKKCQWEDLDGGNILPGFTLNLSIIEKIISQDVDEMGDKCPYCDSSFIKVYDMMEHLNKVHLIVDN
ncbi:hypothetical protein GLOIN_2v1840344 [Rhizophagus clarus]|uniref:C2H2-type domain-containing protein n=1 Tax=Rhizophagus clarus TaxID=94130 RepID=A0A8H3MIP9_9GLOM|nr:hypothetical protein GLOIN_2v1840344 [Rhizophagus clarus]